MHSSEIKVPINSNEKWKAFLSDQCNKIEENNRIGKTRDLFKNRDIKGTFHAKMYTTKERNFRGITEVEDFQKRW